MKSEISTQDDGVAGTAAQQPMPLIATWLAARSIARGLPPPVADHGGYRLDTNTADEIVRWVYPEVGPSLSALARAIDRPCHMVKACAAPEQLRAALPEGWMVHAPGYFMAGPAAPVAPPACPAGYTLEVARTGAVTQVRIVADGGELAASAFAAETAEAFIYDRVVTAPGHRRRGLGRVLMAALRQAKQRPAAPELLVATEEGRALYQALGWRTLSIFSTGSLPSDLSSQ
jgi:GNAT superfamily N-acetyltransferase